MPTEVEIKTRYKKLHDDLSEAYYGGTSGLTKEEFDIQHGKVWNDMEAELIVEGYLSPPIPRRDLEVEIDDLRTRIKALEAKKEIL